MPKLKIKTNNPKKAASILKALATKPKIAIESSTKLHGDLMSELLRDFMGTIKNITDKL